MRKILPILLMLVLTTPFLAKFGWLKLEKYHVRKAIKHKIMEGVNEELLIHFSFAQSDTSKLLDWKHEKEFGYMGEMYDVVSRKYSNDSVHYSLWWDNEETQLNKNLQALVNNFFTKNQEKRGKDNFFGFVTKQLFFEHCANTLWQPESILRKTKRKFHFLAKSPSDYIKRIFTPPQIIYL